MNNMEERPDFEKLVSLALPHLNTLTLLQVSQIIEDAGPIESSDLLLLTEEDLGDVLRPLQRRKLLAFFKTHCTNKTSCAQLQRSEHSIPKDKVKLNLTVIKNIEKVSTNSHGVIEPVTQSDDAITCEEPPAKKVKSSNQSDRPVPSQSSQSCEGLSTGAAARLLARFEERLKSVELSLQAITATLSNLAEHNNGRDDHSSGLSPGRADSLEKLQNIIDGVFPIEDEDSFNELEENMHQNEMLRAAVENKLRVIGGCNLKDAVRRILNATMTNSLQTRFNWVGRKGCKAKYDGVSKRAFSTTKFCESIIKVLLRNGTLDCTESSIGRSIMVFLRNSADRAGGRKRRRQQQEGTGECIEHEVQHRSISAAIEMVFKKEHQEEELEDDELY